jgi:ABC-type nitrate/sulfonate/bicarbonate transport system substrate-binding protein
LKALAKLPRALVVASALALLIGACAADSPGERQGSPAASGGSKVRPILFSSSITNWCYYVAVDQGFFQREQIELAAPLEVTNDADTTRALLASSGDIALGTIGIAQAVSRGQTDQPRIIAATSQAPYSFVGPRAITAIDQLKGRTFALGPETQPSTLLASATLDRVLGSGNWKALHVGGGTPQRLAAIDAGQADAAFAASPGDEKIAEDGRSHIITHLSDLGARYQVGVVISTKRWLEANSDLAVRWLRAYSDGCEFIQDPQNKDASVKALAANVDVSEAIASKAYTTYVTGPNKGQTPPPDGRIDRTALANLLEIMRDAGQLSQEGTVDQLVSKVVDESYLDRAR